MDPQHLCNEDRLDQSTKSEGIGKPLLLLYFMEIIPMGSRIVSASGECLKRTVPAKLAAAAPSYLGKGRSETDCDAQPNLCRSR